jgi:hypothetical protein
MKIAIVSAFFVAAAHAGGYLSSCVHCHQESAGIECTCRRSDGVAVENWIDLNGCFANYCGKLTLAR